MTNELDFHQAFVAFMDMSYPDYPRAEELRDWNSHLLTLDVHVAGYATRVNSGQLSAGGVPDVDGLVREVESLRRALDVVRSKVESEESLVNKYLSYVSALERLVKAIRDLAESESA